MKVLKDGLSGIMCIKNESRFLEDCIDSCIGALDELIVVYIKGNDTTEDILKKKKEQHGPKLSYFLYPYEVLWFDMTQNEYEVARNLKDNDPKLYSSMCNFALSKVKYKYVIKKVDADQFYFTEELKRWRDICSESTIPPKSIESRIGALIGIYISLYRRLSALIGTPLLFMLPERLLCKSYKYYKQYAICELKRNRAVISLSGLNVFKDEDWYVPFDGKNIHPPYNGEGDHIIFPLSDKTFFKKHTSNRAENRRSYSVTEDFIHPYKVMIGGVCWFHQHANRKHCWERIKKEKDKSPEAFMPINNFIKLPTRAFLINMRNKIDILHKKIYFSIVHMISKKQIELYKDYLNRYNI